VLLLSAGALVLSRGTGPVAVPVPTVTAGVAAACARVVSLLPDRLVGAPRRATTPPSGLTRAWDTRPVQVLRCGTGRGAADLLPADYEYDVDGVAWFREVQLAPARDGLRRWTTRVGPGLEIRVPDGGERDLINAGTDALRGLRR